MPDPWDSNEGQTHYLDENGQTVGGDVSAREVGVQVWRIPGHSGFVDGYVGSPIVAAAAPDTEPGRWFPEPVAVRLIEAERERDRLRERIHEVQRNADARNAELHKRVTYYESIRDRTNEIINRFKVERPFVRKDGTEGGSVIEWFADEEHLQALVEQGYARPGNTIGFWFAFRMVLEAERDARIDPDDPEVRERIWACFEDIVIVGTTPEEYEDLLQAIIDALRSTERGAR